MWRHAVQELSMAHIHLQDGDFSIQWLIFSLVAAPITTALRLRCQQAIIAVRLSTTTIITASFAIFQVNVPFAGGDLADCSAHTERVRQ